MIEADDEQQRTLFCGNLHENVTEEHLYELFLQAGPLDKVKIVADKVNKKKRFSFITFKHAISVSYTLSLMSGIRLFNQQLRLQTRGGSGGLTPETYGSRRESASPGINFPGSPGYIISPGFFSPPDQGGQFHRSVSAPDVARRLSAGPEESSQYADPRNDNRQRNPSYSTRGESLQAQGPYSGGSGDRRQDSRQHSGGGPMRRGQFDTDAGSPPYGSPSHRSHSDFDLQLVQERARNIVNELQRRHQQHPVRHNPYGTNAPWQQQSYRRKY